MIKARHRRRFHFVVFLIALGPGGLVSVLYPRAIPWIVFMSWASMVYAPLTAWAAETPVEEEKK